MPADDEAREIARGLTKAQRKALLWLVVSEDWQERGKANKEISRPSLFAMHNVCRGDPRKRLCITYSLCECAAPKMEGGRWLPDAWRLTPLGSRVRAALTEMEARGDGE